MAMMEELRLGPSPKQTYDIDEKFFDEFRLRAQWAPKPRILTRSTIEDHGGPQESELVGRALLRGAPWLSIVLRVRILVTAQVLADTEWV